MALIGHARMSTKDQSLDMQLDALERSGCAKAFTEKASGKTKNRPQLKAALRLDGRVIIHKLDRLGRSMKDLLEITDSMVERNIGPISIRNNIDMIGTTGCLSFHFMACLSEFERVLISESTFCRYNRERKLALQSTTEKGN